MAIQDMPHLTPEYIPRVEKFAEKVKCGEVKPGSIMEAILPPLVKNVMPAIMKTGGHQLAAILPQLITAFPSLLEKQVFIKVKGGGSYMAKIGLPPKFFQFIPCSLNEIKSAGVPGIVFDPGKASHMILGFDGIVWALAEGVVNIYGLDQLLGMLRDPSGKGVFADILPVFLSILTSEVLLSMEEPVKTAVDKLLTTYGV